MIEDYLADEADDCPALSTLEKGWVQVVDEFVSRYDRLYKTMEPELGSFSPDYSPQVRSRASSRASSISEGHVSPEDDGPSKKVVCYDN